MIEHSHQNSKYCRIHVKTKQTWFSHKTVVIWWLLNDKLREREQEKNRNWKYKPKAFVATYDIVAVTLVTSATAMKQASLLHTLVFIKLAKIGGNV